MQANIKSAQNGIDDNFITKWDGQGITSSTARASNVATGFDLVGLGVIRNSDLAVTTGLPHAPYTTFSGQPVGPDDVLIKFTYVGDGNFDGQVDFDDFVAMDNTFFGLTPNLGWASGDINFDGEINFDDYTVVDQSYFFQGAPLSGGGGISFAFASAEAHAANEFAGSISPLAPQRQCRNLTRDCRRQCRIVVNGEWRSCRSQVVADQRRPRSSRRLITRQSTMRSKPCRWQLPTARWQNKSRPHPTKSGQMSRLVGEMFHKPHKWPARHGTVEFDRAISVFGPLWECGQANCPSERIDAITNPADTIHPRTAVSP